MPGNKNDRAQLVKTRRAEALRLRLIGHSYQRIADHMGVSVPMAYKYVNQSLDEIAKQATEDAFKVRQIELDRLDLMNAAMMPAALQGDQGAVEKVLKIQERRARLLGLDAPTKLSTEINGALGVQFILPAQQLGEEPAAPSIDSPAPIPIESVAE